jgi:hypothetical protein
MSNGRVQRLRTLVVLAVFTAVALGPAAAQERDERAVRVAYLYSLIKFVDWPGLQKELLIGYVGSPATGETLFKSLDGRRDDARTLHVVLSPSDDMLVKCRTKSTRPWRKSRDAPCSPLEKRTRSRTVAAWLALSRRMTTFRS